MIKLKRRRKIYTSTNNSNKVAVNEEYKGQKEYDFKQGAPCKILDSVGNVYRYPIPTPGDFGKITKNTSSFSKSHPTDQKPVLMYSPSGDVVEADASNSKGYRVIHYKDQWFSRFDAYLWLRIFNYNSKILGDLFFPDTLFISTIITACTKLTKWINSLSSAEIAAQHALNTFEQTLLQQCYSTLKMTPLTSDKFIPDGPDWSPLAVAQLQQDEDNVFQGVLYSYILCTPFRF